MEFQPSSSSVPLSLPPPSTTLSVPGKLYAVGGYDGASRQCLSTVEQYNPATNEWTYVADMSTRRSGAGTRSLRAQAMSDPLPGGSGDQQLNILPYFTFPFFAFNVCIPTGTFPARHKHLHVNLSQGIFSSASSLPSLWK